jgi:hypothetical protein
MQTQFSPFPLWALIMEFLGHDTTEASPSWSVQVRGGQTPVRLLPGMAIPLNTISMATANDAFQAAGR